MKPSTIKIEMKFDCQFDGGLANDHLCNLAKSVNRGADLSTMVSTVKSNLGLNHTTVVLEFDVNE